MFSDDCVSHYAIFEFIKQVVGEEPCRNLIPFLGNRDDQNRGLDKIGDSEAALLKTSKHGSKLNALWISISTDTVEALSYFSLRSSQTFFEVSAVAGIPMTIAS